MTNDPNCATIISKNFDSSKITQLKSSIKITLDNSESYEVSVFNSLYSNQTLDTVIFTLNDYAVLSGLDYKEKKVIDEEKAFNKKLFESADLSVRPF